MTMPRSKRTLWHHHHTTSSKRRNSNILTLCLLLLSPRKVTAKSLVLGTNFSSLSLTPKTAFKTHEEPTRIMRAWMCHGRNHRDMVEKLSAAGTVKNPINKEALLRVDRKNYVHNADRAYDDSPQSIGYGATISAPHMHAHVLEDLLPPLLRASKDDPNQPLSILDVGCGSGYLTAVFGRMVEGKKDALSSSLLEALPSPQEYVLNSGKVYGIDIIPQLIELSKHNIQKSDGDLFKSNTVQVMVRDGWKGYQEGAPYQAIHVGAAAETFPKELMIQLALGGVMMIPVGPQGGEQYLYRVERLGYEGGRNQFREDDFRIVKVLGVRYVPLVRVD